LLLLLVLLLLLAEARRVLPVFTELVRAWVIGMTGVNMRVGLYVGMCSGHVYNLTCWRGREGRAASGAGCRVLGVCAGR
jgi:hypothetical protein